MQLSLPTDSAVLQEMFERFFAAESTPGRVRAAEPTGFDAELWRNLVALEVPFLRTAAGAGGGGMGLFDACLMMEQAGRRLASAPLAEAVVALRILGEAGGAAEWLEKARDGKTVLTLALRQAVPGQEQFVPGAAVATGIITFDGRQLAIETRREALEAPFTLGASALGRFTPGQGERTVIAEGAEAAKIWAEGIEEWKLLTGAALIGLSCEATEMAASYASEREAFGQKIGGYQAISHPLATDIVEADGGALLLWRTLRAIADGDADAGALASLFFWWASRNATNAVAHAIHTLGGYGLSNEYDIQLYHRRAKSWAQALGDPETELLRAGRRLYRGEEARLPDVGTIEIDFKGPDTGQGIAAELRRLFAGILDPRVHRLHEYNFEAHSWDVHKAIGQAGLLFPEWPKKWGGRGADAEAARAADEVWLEVGYAGFPRGVTGMAGALVQSFGTPELQDEVLLRFARGEATSCLGFTEPSGGSDVFAAKTRAVRDGGDWIINGQKMFTSGAELASYVLLLARTDPDAPKHKGLTLFLAPLDSPGVEIHPIQTFMDERTNATFYADVRVPDRYRLGEVNQGVKAMSLALSMEQGGTMYHRQMREMVEAVAEWARVETREGRPVLEHDGTLTRLARVYAEAAITEALNARSLWTRVSGAQDRAYGPATKTFATDAFIRSSADLVDLAAPDALVRGKTGLGVVEKGYRHATATSIYGGTTEVLRSMVAERRLGLPRSRS